MYCGQCGTQLHAQEVFCHSCGALAMAGSGATVATVETLPFFPVATHKFVAMSICSFGLYELYWFYQNWKAIRNTGRNISPFWRTFFAPFCAYSLFTDIRARALAEQMPAAWSAGLLAVGYFATQMLWRLPDPWWLISIATFVPMLPAQQAAQRINRHCHPSADGNGRYSAANIIGLI